jgi:hypothetical protein
MMGNFSMWYGIADVAFKAFNWIKGYFATIFSPGVIADVEFVKFLSTFDSYWL